MSATAISAPALHCAPNAAYWPVIGPAVAMVMSAPAGLATARVSVNHNDLFRDIWLLLSSQTSTLATCGRDRRHRLFPAAPATMTPPSASSTTTDRSAGTTSD